MVFASYQLLSQDNIFLYSDLDYTVTSNKDNSQSLHVDVDLLEQIVLEDPNSLFISLPLLEGQYLDVNMRKFSVLNQNHDLIIERSNSSKEIIEYIPSFISYMIMHDQESIGTFIIFENSILVSFKYNNRQLEINKIDDHFLLFDVNDCLINKTFSCEIKEKVDEVIPVEDFSESSSSTPKCLELAIEIDQYTRSIEIPTSEGAWNIGRMISEFLDKFPNCQLIML